MPYGTVNADVIQTSTSGGILGAGNASIMKNRIQNGAMVIDQRNDGASYTAVNYCLDRWYYELSQASKFSGQQNQGSITPPAGFTNYLGSTVTSAVSVGAIDYFLLSQSIEGFNVADLGWGTAQAKPVCLSFQVYSSLTGTFGGSVNNSSQGRNYPFSYTVSSANTWTSISVTIPGDTSGTWLTTNGIGVRLRFGLGVGSTYSGTAGAWTSSLVFAPSGAVSVVGTNGATFYITGCQLEVGSSATGFEYVNYQTSLANCQRYYWKNKPDVLYGWIATGRQDSTTVSLLISYPTVMRSAPTFNYSNLALSSGTIGAAVATYAGNTSALYQVGCTSGTTNGYVNAIQQNSAGVGYLEASSEL